jgi:hypothetical protein
MRWAPGGGRKPGRDRAGKNQQLLGCQNVAIARLRPPNKRWDVLRSVCLEDSPLKASVLAGAYVIEERKSKGSFRVGHVSRG